MKTFFLKSISVLTILIICSGCFAIHNGYMANSASLSSNNFSYVKQGISGESKATYIFGIGGMARKTLVNEAKQKMLANNPLQSNQALVNLTVNFKASFVLIFIYKSVRCTVTADVVEFK